MREENKLIELLRGKSEIDYMSFIFAISYIVKTYFVSLLFYFLGETKLKSVMIYSSRYESLT